MVRRLSYYNFQSSNNDIDEYDDWVSDVPDDWDTGIRPDDPNHYWNKDEVFESGLFINQKINEQIQRENDTRFNRPAIVSNMTYIGIELFKYIASGFICLVLIYFFVIGLLKMSEKKEVIKPSIVYEEVQEDDKYGKKNIY